MATETAEIKPCDEAKRALPDGARSDGSGRRLLRRWTALVLTALVLVAWVSWRVHHGGPGPAGPGGSVPGGSVPGGSVPGGSVPGGSVPGGTQPALYRCTMPQCNDPGTSEPGTRCPVCNMQRELVSSAQQHPEPAPAWYRCTMPQCNDPGSADASSRCPVCGMRRELVAGGAPGGPSNAPAEIRLDERARRLASLTTEEVTRRPLQRRIKAVGRVAFDEQRYVVVSARISGTIETLAADYTGKQVNRGEELLQIYSLDLLQAQNELLRLIWGFGRIAGRGRNRSVDQDLVTARHRLELMGMTASDIDKLLENDHEHPYLAVTAPINGTIISKQVYLGGYVDPGDTMLEIADLSRVWLLLELYEEDLPWISLGQEVLATTRSLPDKELSGRITFIDPVVDAQSRTISVRVEAANPGHLLKPGMFAQAHVVVQLAGASGAQLPLSVPRSAVLSTGERDIVYLETAPGTYRGVEIAIGSLAEDKDGRHYYPVSAGLEEGQRVVTRGGFVIDSQMQIAGLPSLLSRGRGNGAEPAVQRSQTPAAPPSPAVVARPPARSAPVAWQQPDRQAAAPELHGELTTVQELCPVMGNPIDRSVYIDYQGVRIFFCCHLCTPKFLAEPERYLAKLPPVMQEQILANRQRLALAVGSPDDGWP